MALTVTGSMHAAGDLLVIKKVIHLSKSMQATPLSFCPDGWLRMGHHVMLVNHRTGGCLCTDISDTMQKPTGLAYGCTTGLSYNCTARNTFEVCRRYKILTIRGSARLVESMLGDDVSRILREHDLTVLHADARVRYEHEGQPVPVNVAVVIKHVHTDQMLASAKINYPNGFGKEYEVHCKSYFLHNKTQNLIAESSGRTTSDIDSRMQDAENNWIFVTSTKTPPRGSEATGVPFDDRLARCRLTSPKTKHPASTQKSKNRATSN